VDLGSLDEVEVVQHEDEVLLEGGEVVEDGTQCLLDLRFRRFKQSGGIAAGLRHRLLQSRDDISPEPGRLVVTEIQRQPRRWLGWRERGYPIGDERRFAEAGWCRYQRELRGRAARQTLRQAGSIDATRALSGGVKLRLDQISRHRGPVLGGPKDRRPTAARR
jgi:hypothetical protein